MAAAGESHQPPSLESMEITWNEYLQRAAAGEQQALARLYDDTSHLIYSVAVRILGDPADAEEVTVDVFSQVWRSASTFDRERGTPLGWLTMLARSRALDRLRRRVSRARFEAPLDAMGEPAAGLDPPEENAALAEERRRVVEALDELAPEQRAAIEMAYFEGYSHSELAERLGQPLGTVKTRIRLGMQKLRDRLGGRTS
jgi:RNA polymerase sigma-70 factor (ECF subfamily)